MKEKIVLMASFALGFCIGCIIKEGTKTCEIGKTEVITLRDTVRITSPERVRTVRLKPDTVWMPVAGGDDSARVTVERQQVEYVGEDYRAFVSGYRPALDSLVMTKSCTIIGVKPTNPTRTPHFSAGLQAGYGITPRGFQPYVGVGISYSISF